MIISSSITSPISNVQLHPHVDILLQEPFEQPVILLFPTVKLRNVIFNEFEELMELLETIPKTV
jgi:hypothetical protein